MITWFPTAKVVGLIALLALAACPLDALAQNVRGRIIFPNGAPMAGVGVRVCANNNACSSFAVTGFDGMYYLYQIPAGQYQLQFFMGTHNLRASYSIQVMPIPWNDIAPVVL